MVKVKVVPGRHGNTPTRARIPILSHACESLALARAADLRPYRRFQRALLFKSWTVESWFGAKQLKNKGRKSAFFATHGCCCLTARIGLTRSLTRGVIADRFGGEEEGEITQNLAVLLDRNRCVPYALRFPQPPMATHWF